MIGINSKTLAIGAALLVGAVLAVSVFKVSLSTLGYVALIGFMFLMHGGHGGHQDDASRDEHAGHAVESTLVENAKSIAEDSNARGLASGESAKAVTQEESHRHHGC